MDFKLKNMKYLMIILAFSLLSGTVIYQAVRHDTTMTGEGITGSELKVDTTVISTRAYVQGDRDDNRALAAGHPAESITNSAATDQDYTSIYTIPANYLVENKAIRVTLHYETVTGASTVTHSTYLKLGSTKVYAVSTATDANNGTTRTGYMVFLILGTAAASGSSATETSGVTNMGYTSTGQLNSIDQPVNLATNGTLNVVPGVTYSGTGSTETMTLRAFTIEEVN